MREDTGGNSKALARMKGDLDVELRYAEVDDCFITRKDDGKGPGRVTSIEMHDMARSSAHGKRGA